MTIYGLHKREKIENRNLYFFEQCAPIIIVIFDIF
jgi:hypothetical protein